MPRLNLLAFAATLLFADAPALAWEPEVVGLDDPGAPAATFVATAAVASPAWEPEIVGLGDTAAAGAFLALEAVDAVALVTPPMVDSGSGPAAAAPLAATRAGRGTGEPLACACPCM